MTEVLIMWPKAKHLYDARRAKGYTQQDLAAAAHVPKRNIESMEGGLRYINNAGAAQVIRLAHALDVPPESLLETETDVEK